MPITRISIDGLWRCLCPSFDTLPQRFLRPNKRLAPRRARAFHTSTSLPNSVAPQPSEPSEPTSNYSPILEHPINTLHIEQSPFQSPSWGLNPKVSTTTKPSAKTRARVIDVRLPTDLDTYTLPRLHDLLRSLTIRQGAYHMIVDLVEYLVTKRGEKIGLAHFNALIRANADATFGSAVVIRGLLEQMKKLGVVGDSGLYHGALLALSIHPDYVLRNDIMDEMKSRWYGLSPEGWHHLVVGLLRDHHLEVAMDKLEQMHLDQIGVQPWLYDIFLFQLCAWDELDEALNLLIYRYETIGEHIPPTIWVYMLDRFTAGHHYDGTKYVWRAKVQNAHLNPSDGTCIAILNLAARHSDPGLATSALRILSGRRVALSSYHYEALLEAYVDSGDLKTAFRILVIMSKAGLEPDMNSTRGIHLYLMSEKSTPERAWNILESMQEDGHLIPVAAVNVVLETLNRQGNREEALNLYKRMHNLCKADTETFNTLLRRLSTHKKDLDTAKSTAMFLAAEMQALAIKPDRVTYDRLIIICSEYTDYEDAFRYWDEMKEVGKVRTGKEWELRTGTLEKLMKRCVRSGDERAWNLIKQLGGRGVDTAQVLWWAEKKWKVDETTDKEEWPQLRTATLDFT